MKKREINAFIIKKKNLKLSSVIQVNDGKYVRIQDVLGHSIMQIQSNFFVNEFRFIYWTFFFISIRGM